MRGGMVSRILARWPGGCLSAAVISPSPPEDAVAMRSARDTMARRTPSARGCPEADRTPAAASSAAIWFQLAPEERSSRKNGRNLPMTGCIARRPSGPSNAAANRSAFCRAVFFVIMRTGCHGGPSAATARSNLQRLLATEALRLVAIRCFLFHSHLCIPPMPAEQERMASEPGRV